MDTELITSMLTQHQRDITGFLTMLTGDRWTADDLFQETCLDAMRMQEKYQEGSNFAAWIRSIARINALRYMRARGRREQFFTPETVDALAETWAEQTRQPLYDHRPAALKKCMEQLPGHHRDILDMRYKDRRGHQYIADHLERSVSSVKMLISRLRKKLRLCVEMKITDIETQMIEES